MSYSGPAVVAPRPTQIIISSFSLEAIGLDLRVMAQATPASTNYPAVNTAILVPFGIAEAITVLKLWVQNGTAVAGNIDLGIFNPDGTMVINKGSTAQANTSTIQELDITDTVLMPGRYYMGITSDTSGATQKVFTTTIAVGGIGSAMGVLQAAQGPALANLTLATFAQTAIPYFGLTARTLVV